MIIQHINRIALIGLSVSLLAAGCAPEPPAQTPKVLLIGIDGVRPDVLAEVNTPHLDSLAARGTFTPHARTGFPSVSGPGWSSFLIGVWPDKHGVTNNEFEGKNYEAYPDIFTRIESINPDLETFVVADWLPLVANDHNGPVISEHVDTKHVLDGYELGWPEADDESVRRAEVALAESDPDAMFVYLGNPDEISHHFRSIGDEYRHAIEAADRHVGRLIASIADRETYHNEDWLVLVSTDHGRTAEGGHGGDTYKERRPLITFPTHRFQAHERIHALLEFCTAPDQTEFDCPELFESAPFFLECPSPFRRVQHLHVVRCH